MLKNSHQADESLDNSDAYEAIFFSEAEKELYNKNNIAASSDILDSIIEGREKLFSQYPNGTLAWLLANSYQMYGYNYLKQTNEANSILYLYMQSIYYTKMSLIFDMEIEDKEIRFKYIQNRYKDIADCNILDNEIRFRAKEIYLAMDRVLDSNNLSEQWISISYDMNTT